MNASVQAPRRACTVFAILAYISVFASGCSLLFPHVEVTVVNDTNDTCTGFYATDSYGDGGDANLLEDVLSPGANCVISLWRDSYNFRATFEFSSALFLPDVNLSSVEIFTVYLEAE